MTLVYKENQLLIHGGDASSFDPDVDDGLSARSLARIDYVEPEDGAGTRAILLPPDAEAPAGSAFVALRDILEISATPGRESEPGSFRREVLRRVLRARHLLHFVRDRPFCPGCGKPVEFSGAERALRCPACGRLEFPRISPAVIVRVELGDKILLAGNARFRPGFRSLVAGFVEAGETLEEAAVREVMEETGIRIGGLRYEASDPWPFPESLMIGFSAKAESSEITVDGVEIMEADWHGVDDLPETPAPGTLAHDLIGGFAVDRRRGRT